MTGVLRKRFLTQVDAAGGVSLPGEWLSKLGWQIGDDLEIRWDGSAIYLNKAPKHPKLICIPFNRLQLLRLLAPLASQLCRRLRR